MTPTALAALTDEEFSDELQENLAANNFTAFLADDVAARTRNALIDLKSRTIALAQLTTDPDKIARRRRFAMLLDSRISRATAAMKDANRRNDGDDQISKYAAFADRLCRELRRSDHAHALDIIELAPGVTAAQWLAARETKR
ncbi:hypothetical protein AB0P19_02220 [Microbacterium oleivorans]|uniref:hypothetical protein n=1 Tax=Microbacterium oleivorans TaxID=273677 RepID=UPI00344A64A8